MSIPWMKGRKLDVPAEAIECAVAMLASGATWVSMSKATGFSTEVLRTRLDPAYAARRKAQEERRKLRRNRRVDSFTRSGAVRESAHFIPREEMKRILSTVPRDTRDFTARVFGDPLPGRSALDAKRKSTEQGSRAIIHTTHSGMP